MDKIERIRKEIEVLYDYWKYGSSIEAKYRCKVYKELLEDIDTLQKEPVNEDLEETIDGYTRKVLERTNCLMGNQPVGEEISKAVRFGANWQKELMIKDAVSGEVAEGSLCPEIETIPVLTHTDMILLPKDKFKRGDKVKIIIIKED